MRRKNEDAGLGKEKRSGHKHLLLRIRRCARIDSFFSVGATGLSIVGSRGKMFPFFYRKRNSNAQHETSALVVGTTSASACDYER